MFKKIIVPIDGSAPSHHAIKVAGNIANQYDAKLVLAHVLFNGASLSKIIDTATNEGFLEEIEKELANDPMVSYSETAAYSGSVITEAVDMVSHETEAKVSALLLKHAQQEASESNVKAIETKSLEGHPAEAILKFAEEIDVDLIVTGSRGFGDIKSLLLGSFSHKLIHEANCPCLIVR